MSHYWHYETAFVPKMAWIGGGRTLIGGQRTDVIRETYSFPANHMFDAIS